MDSDWALTLLDHLDPPVRWWALRLLDRPTSIPRPLHKKMVALGLREPDAEVRSELANAVGRLETRDALAVLDALIRRHEDVSDKHIPLRIWWALEELITRDADAVLDWLDTNRVWEAPLFTGHLASRVARRLAADRGDTHSFTRIDPDRNWQEYAGHPRSPMPGGKGDYTEWESNDTLEIRDRNLTRLARLLEMAPASHRERLLSGTRAGLERGAAPAQVPSRLRAVIDGWWAVQPHTGDLLHVAARLGHPDAATAVAAAAERGNVVSTAERTAAGAADERGRTAFLTYCAPCHQTDGSGMARLATPLRNSKWVLGKEELLARIVLNGLKDDLLMPPMSTLDDQQLAAILTYIRRAWGHEGGRVSAEMVGRVRAASSGRTAPWTRAELSALPVPD
jgi:mono/diheme cytochrome c family protein